MVFATSLSIEMPSSILTLSLITLVIISQCLHRCVSAEYKDHPSSQEEHNVQRSDFPIDFRFGASTSAIQIEGAINEDGRKPSVWEGFLQKSPGNISVDLGVNSYHMYKEDVKALKDAGLDSYRFSISWPRVMPEGTLQGGVNPKAIEYYNNLIDELLENGITPFVTLFHFDSPQALQDKYRGLLSRNIVDDFKDYSEVCYKAFGDRVKNWITINEPLVIANYGYGLGAAAPGRCSKSVGNCPEGDSLVEPYIVAHHLILAHAASSRLYREKFQDTQKGQVGMSLVAEWYEPYSNSTEDRKAVNRALDFSFGWFMDPLTYGDYPSTMKSFVKNRLPKFTYDEKMMVKGSADFVGINYYGAKYAKDIPAKPNEVDTSSTDDLHVDREAYRNGVAIGPKFAVVDAYLYPKGIKKMLLYMKHRYQRPMIYITENGVTEARNDTQPMEDALKDQQRIDSIQRHLHYVREAKREGVNVKGYFVWTLMDTMELTDGYSARYGLYYTDYTDNFKRYPKDSAKWLKIFLFNQSSLLTYEEIPCGKLGRKDLYNSIANLSMSL